MEDDNIDEDEIDVDSLNVDVITYACEDCDHRWEASSEEDYLDSWELICPMCGAANITEL